MKQPKNQGQYNNDSNNYTRENLFLKKKKKYDKFIERERGKKILVLQSI